MPSNPARAPLRCPEFLAMYIWHSKDKDAGKYVQIKAVSCSEATIISYELYKEGKVQQSLKRWIASKHIHPKNCVRLSAQKGSRDINLLYLVADGNSTPLMVCDDCLHIKVIE